MRHRKMYDAGFRLPCRQLFFLFGCEAQTKCCQDRDVLRLEGGLQIFETNPNQNMQCFG